MLGDRSAPLAHSRFEGPGLFGRPATAGADQTGGTVSNEKPAGLSDKAQLHPKQEKELCDPVPLDNLSRGAAGLGVHDSPAVPGETGKQMTLLWHVRPRKTITVMNIMLLLRMMAAARPVVPLGLLHMKRVQLWFVGDLYPSPNAPTHKYNGADDGLESAAAFCPSGLGPTRPGPHGQQGSLGIHKPPVGWGGGGVRSPNLLNIARLLLLWTHSLVATHNNKSG